VIAMLRDDSTRTSCSAKSILKVVVLLIMNRHFTTIIFIYYRVFIAPEISPF
jgi:hypothetical protein